MINPTTIECELLQVAIKILRDLEGCITSEQPAWDALNQQRAVIEKYKKEFGIE